MRCSCPADWLCDQCIETGVEHLGGAAWNRGFTWAESVSRRTTVRDPWPATARARRLAVERVADLTPDPRLRERLADQVEAGARERWSAGSIRGWRDGIAARLATRPRP